MRRFSLPTTADFQARRAACPFTRPLDRRTLNARLLGAVLLAMLVRLLYVPLDGFERWALPLLSVLMSGLLLTLTVTRVQLRTLHVLTLLGAWGYVLGHLWHVLFRVPAETQMQVLGSLGPWAAVLLASHLWLLGRRVSLPLSLLALGSTAALLLAHVLLTPGALQQPVVGAVLQLLLGGAVLLAGQHSAAHRALGDLRRDLLGDGDAGRETLTGLPGRAMMERWLTRQAQRRPEGLGVAVIGLDAPHPGVPADATPEPHRLAHVARVILGAVRDDDLLGCLDDGQLVLVLRAADARSARAVCERLRVRVASRPVDGANVTVSIALAFQDGRQDGLTLLREAEDSLNALHQTGQNRVVLGAPPTEAPNPDTLGLQMQPA
ncbi:hypothetical protein K7W42_16205 [Deinococcus sp. HMF7604]|uniref:GGDEF domain-containing protein n=1 Tax=Deinococcus betulae TaxID=2873312 RepID=UPI001CCDFF94|nr:GGDEF domain-containing protein [Deinococcus betulae]MBZ9752395.1 hypothetical protein [Deinococcus betulae]